MRTEIKLENLDLDVIYNFLDRLRESGRINMFGAAPYIAETFGLSRQESRQALSSWMKTFGERHV